MKYVSNRANAEEYIGQLIRKELLRDAVEYEQILDQELTAPKHGTVYGAEHEVMFNTFDPNSQRYRPVGFIANRGKRLGKGRRGQGVHQASAPGEAPAIMTAALRKSVMHSLSRIDKLNWSVKIGVSLQGGRGGPTGSTSRSIADDLEFGTTRMAPRPAWRPALVALRARMKLLTGRRRADTEVFNPS